MGLLSLVLNNHIRNDDDDESKPLNIYGPQGLHEYLCTIIRLTDTAITQEVVVHEMVLTDDDVKRTFFNKPIPWYKPLNKFQHEPCTPY
jgi:ribonuclease BN (tRNA processing enzyme)